MILKLVWFIVMVILFVVNVIYSLMLVRDFNKTKNMDIYPLLIKQLGIYILFWVVFPLSFILGYGGTLL